MRQAVLFSGVAPSARRYHVLPGVRPTFTARDDVIEVLGGTAAVLASGAVSSEHGTTVHGYPILPRDIDIADEPDHRWFGHRYVLGPEESIGGVDQFGLGIQDEEDRSPGGDDPQRLEGGIEDQGSIRLHSRGARRPSRRR
jgi:hypothetical protein